MAVTIRDVLHTYRNAHAGYERIIGIGTAPQLARNAVALLVWIDQGHDDLMSHLPALTPDAVVHLTNEAGAVIDSLHLGTLVPPPTPLISALSHDGVGIDPGTFAYNQELIVRTLADFLEGVGNLVFDDRLYRLFNRHQTGVLGRYQELEEPYVSPLPVTVPEDCRSMFITFSRGQAVERDEIFDYFRHKWGDCIVRVLMEKTTGGTPPMYGRIIFKRPAFVSLVLNGEEHVYIFIRDREIWLRKYIPRPNNG
ncbi:hypothetical protein SEVIR_3G306200v4 [Setaria viridis]|uniref:RRM domain-containing protein n=1 Tax=Setaria viridis TaxID=4556 RepID=A0A4U6VL36_SETVI|nr:hypothetical protein SEVIR_3G306200v2 [Setaria viridis]